jgi:hypothetical protein
MALKEVITEKRESQPEPVIKEQPLIPDPNGQYYFDGEAQVDDVQLKAPILEIDVVDHDTVRVTGEKSDGRILQTVFSREQINNARIQGESARAAKIKLVWFDPYQSA